MTLPLYVLSGLGADERLFAPQRAVRDVRSIALIPPAGGGQAILPVRVPGRTGTGRIACPPPSEPLTEYASRLARTLDLPSEFDLAGASFGGMLALELARHISPRRVYLLGSCRSPSSIAPMLRTLRRFAFPPPRFTHALIARYFGAASHARVFSEMLAATPREQLRWAVHAIFTWPGVAELPMPIVHIHGDRDRVIPLSRVRADHVIAGAGHLLTLTHPEAVNETLAV